MQYDSSDSTPKGTANPVQAMTNPAAFGTPGDPPPSAGSVFNGRMARASALAVLTVIFSGIAYSRESGFNIYALLFAIPFTVFVLVRNSRKWQAWGWALAWVIIALAFVPAAFITLGITRRMHRSDVAELVFLMALLLTLAAQLFFVRRTFHGKIAFGMPLFRATLYYVCLLLVVAATLPNWYVPPIVRCENKAVDNLRKYCAAMDLYARTSKGASYPTKLSELAVPPEARRITPSLDSDLVCAQASCLLNGYRFEYRPLFMDGHVESYTISARPLEFGETGKSSFLLAADRTIHETGEDRGALLTDGVR